jgi:hypothetical protein
MKNTRTLDPEAAADLDRCAQCGHRIPEDEDRMIAILGASGEDIVITRFCLGCGLGAAREEQDK